MRRQDPHLCHLWLAKSGPSADLSTSESREEHLAATGQLSVFPSLVGMWVSLEKYRENLIPQSSVASRQHLKDTFGALCVRHFAWC